MRATIQSTTRSLLLLALCYANAVAQNGAAPPPPPPQQRQPATAALPASLSNAEFWDIVSQFSEAGGSFPSDNFTSNELMIGQVAADISARGKTGGAYLGVGPEQNFTYIAALKPQIVFIVDIRRQAVMQHLMYKAIFEMSGNRSEFIARLFSKPVQQMTAQDTAIRDIWSKYLAVPADSALYRANIAAIHDHLARVRGFALTSADSALIALVYDVFYHYGPYISYSARAGTSLNVLPSASTGTFLSLTLITDTTGVARSFLATDENYQFIRRLHSRNLFIPVVGDFGGPQALRRVGDYLREHRTVVSGYYTLNVEQYLFRPPTPASPPVWQEYYTSVGLLPLDSSSVFIRPNGMRVNNAQVLGLLQGLPQPAGAPAGFALRPQQTAVGAAPPVPPTPPVQQQLADLGSFAGTVRDSASGNPLQGATVLVAGPPPVATTATTDANGQYTIANVAPGMQGLEVRRVGYSTARAAAVRVSAGAPTVVDFRMAAQPVIVTGIVTTGGMGGFTVVGVAAAPGTGVVLCPILEFLAAYNAGRVFSYADATRCAR